MPTIDVRPFDFDSLKTQMFTDDNGILTFRGRDFLQDLWRRTGGVQNGLISNQNITEDGTTITINSGATFNIAGTFQLGGIAVTATANEINFNDGAIAGTTVANTTIVAGPTKNIDVLTIDTTFNIDGSWFLGGTEVLTSAEVLNTFVNISDSPTDGVILIGNDSTGEYVTNSVDGNDGITIAEGPGTLGIAADINTTNLQFTAAEINTIQDIDTTASPTFAAMTINPGDITMTAFGNLELARETLLNSSTGVFDYDGMTINALDDQQVDVGAGVGQIVDNFTTPDAPTHTEVSWAAETVAISDLTEGAITWIYVDSNGDIQQQNTEPTALQVRQNIFLSQAIVRIFSPSPAAVFGVQDFPYVATSPSSQVDDLYDGFGTINLSCTISNGGTDLTLDFSGGDLLARGRNFVGTATNRATPNTVTLASANPASFIYSTDDPAVSGAFVTDVDPLNYDVSGVVTAIPGSNNRATAQRVNVFPNGVIGIQYGQQFYGNLTDAVQGIATDPYTANPTFAEGGAILLAFLCVRKGATDLSLDTDARFVPAGKLGESATAGGGQSTTTLQQAYNNSLTGTTITAATQGPFDIQGGTGTDTDDAFTVSNNAGTTTFAVQAGGVVDTGTW